MFEELIGGPGGLLGGLWIGRQHASVSAPIGPDREQFRFFPASVGGADGNKRVDPFFGRRATFFEFFE